MVKRRPTEIVQVNLRLQENFRLRLAASAEKAGRSFNQEIVHRLEQSFDTEDRRALVKEAAQEAISLATEGGVLPRPGGKGWEWSTEKKGGRK
jgi:hypothetical protein